MSDRILFCFLKSVMSFKCDVVTFHPPSKSFSQLNIDHQCSHEKNFVFTKQEGPPDRKVQSEASNQDGDFQSE